ncbi:MAG: hypothetical protein JW804_05990 [Sedimentisphaerales bacterium]|nr:hypothetical protein [Sedimentisphaerales bacterium]
MSRILKTESFCGFSFICLLLFLWAAAPLSYSLAAPAERELVIDNIVEKWISIAREQYNRGHYGQAESSLLRALEYEVHLKPEQSELVKNLLAKARSAKTSRGQSLDKIEQAKMLAEQGRLLQAKARISEVMRQKTLGESDRQRAILFDKHLDAQIAREKRLMTELFKESKEHYDKGEYEQARDGFVKVAQSGLYEPMFGTSAEDYLAKIRNLGEQKSSNKEKSEFKIQLWPWVRNEEKQKEVPQEVVDYPPRRQLAVEPDNIAVIKEDDSQIDFIEEQPEQVSGDNIKLSYVKAVVLDAETRATSYAGRSEFNQALSIIENARNTLDKYSDSLDERSFIQYKNRLEALETTVVEQKQRWTRRWDTKVSDN